MIRITWSKEIPCVICLDYVAPVKTWDEYHAAIQQAHELARTSSETVYFVHNPGTMPLPDGNPFPHIFRAMQIAPANTGGVLMLITNVFARRMMELLLKAANVDAGYYFVSSMEDAQNLLNALQQRV